MKTYEIIQHRDQIGIKCLVCGMTSYNKNDVREKFCGHCHKFHDIGKIGETGKFTNGKINEYDKGGLNAEIYVIDEVLFINFGKKPITWLGLRKEEVKGLIKILQEKEKNMR